MKGHFRNTEKCFPLSSLWYLRFHSLTFASRVCRVISHTPYILNTDISGLLGIFLATFLFRAVFVRLAAITASGPATIFRPQALRVWVVTLWYFDSPSTPPIACFRLTD